MAATAAAGHARRGAVGVGDRGSEALFTIINVALLRPLPGINAAEALVEVERAGTGGIGTLSYPDFVDLAAQTQSLEQVYAWSVSPLSVRPAAASNASNSFGLLVSSSYFDALGVRAHSGRLLQQRDMTRDGQTPAAVISFRRISPPASSGHW